MVRQNEDHDDFVGDLIVALLRGLWVVVRWLALRPALLAVLLVLGGMFGLWGWSGVAVGALLLVVSVLGLGLLWRSMFYRLLVDPWRRARARRRYRRRWASALDLCGLAMSRGGQLLVPRLRAVQVGTLRDRLLVHLVMGQSVRDYERACPELAAAFGAQSARVFADRPGRVWLELARADALASVVPALPIPAEPDLSGVVVGLREDGEPWVLSLLGTHVFVAGETGSGKGSVIWSVLRALAVPVRSGLVAVWAVDPKGGMELGFGRPMFARFAHESTETMVALLEEAVRIMDTRCRKLLGHSRLQVPTDKEPLILLVIDELASLTAYETDTKLRARATAAISALLSRGRAAAVVVLAAAQDPRKEVVSFRSLFPTKVALRLDTPSQVDMVLGDGMHAMGAAADQIPGSSPGVGFVTVQDVREPMRVRAGWVSDADIQEVAALFPAPAHATCDVELTDHSPVAGAESGLKGAA
ncbi:FtsK/SpoIIIE domain-containing protein [Nakamurella deserti]|uniref:FtsK/SpoIIIE domain-containing protein n=1 Tax=Nakamurella deserti TaxID=2164074 RepID=UPI0013005D70|nr:FtsK/SpoIIIE domain-containing protein [Nakamurella deserti]